MDMELRPLCCNKETQSAESICNWFSRISYAWALVVETECDREGKGATQRTQTRHLRAPNEECAKPRQGARAWMKGLVRKFSGFRLPLTVTLNFERYGSPLKHPRQQFCEQPTGGKDSTTDCKGGT
jgi:hypothetical protein